MLARFILPPAPRRGQPLAFAKELGAGLATSLRVRSERRGKRISDSVDKDVFDRVLLAVIRLGDFSLK